MTFEIINKLDNIAERKSLSIINKSVDSIDIPCWIYYRTLGDKKTHKYYFIDLTNFEIKKMVEEKFFANFNESQTLSFSEEYFNSPEELNNNIHLIFIIDDMLSKEYTEKENNFEYVRKRFIKSTDLLMFLNTLNYADFSNYISEFYFQDKLYILKRFNYIHGNNGSGKTQIMKVISEQFELPLYSPNVYNKKTFEDLKKMISKIDINRLKFYYKSLWSFSSSKELDTELSCIKSDVELSIIYIASILTEQEREKNSILLIDDIYWNKFDDLRTLNIIDTLDTFSNPAVITGFNDCTKGLVKRKVFDANIIEL